jgi:hypothetical protein
MTTVVPFTDGQRVEIVPHKGDAILTFKWWPRGRTFGTVRKVFPGAQKCTVLVDGLSSAPPYHNIHFIFDDLGTCDDTRQDDH